MRFTVSFCISAGLSLMTVFLFMSGELWEFFLFYGIRKDREHLNEV